MLGLSISFFHWFSFFMQITRKQKFFVFIGYGVGCAILLQCTLANFIHDYHKNAFYFIVFFFFSAHNSVVRRRDDIRRLPSRAARRPAAYLQTLHLRASRQQNAWAQEQAVNCIANQTLNRNKCHTFSREKVIIGMFT